MKNNRAKRAAFEWKHLMSRNHFSMSYMRVKSKFSHQKMCIRWDIKSYRNVILGIIKNAGNFPYSSPGDRAATMQNGVWLEYGNMSFRIQGYGYGVTRNKKNNGKAI